MAAFRPWILILFLLSFWKETVCTPGDSLTLAPPDSVKVDSTFHPGRLAVVASLSLSSYIGSYYVMFKDGWWDGNGTDFHIKNDFDYAKNIDKAGHFFSGVLLGEGFFDGFRWSGMKERNAYLLAGTMASVTMVGVDIKDGFSEWGYSPFDVLAGILGGFYPMAKRY
ncbi:MAG TPA: DUF2279 domain-containing protein, partial [Fibrobacteraceae bacterium]|nr:DUF2279 domain-containing protein [Fibrobacteraceae bacterium]